MTLRTDPARDAVRKFAADIVGRRDPDHICVRFDGADGMASLCALEAAIREHWSEPTTKELVWLSRAATTATVQLQAFAGGVILGAASYELALADA